MKRTHSQKYHKDDDERYENYVQIVRDFEKIRIQEQAKMDNIIITCGIGIVGIDFVFMGLIFKENYKEIWLFMLSIISAIVSICANYFSSWCSVQDCQKSRNILDKNYSKNKDINNEIVTIYTYFVTWLNVIAIIFLLISTGLFLSFVYSNIELNIKG